MAKLAELNQALSELAKICDGKPERYYKTTPGSYSEHEQFLGIPNRKLRALVKLYASLSLDDIQKLLQSPFNEKRLLALFILHHQYLKAKKLKQEKVFVDFYLANLHGVNNWNLVDASAYKILGDFLLTQKNKYVLKDLSSSKNMWKRRIAIVATLAFIKHHEFEWTFKLARILFADKEDLIHKATGWMLREIYKQSPQCSLTFLQKNYQQIPRTTLRYAIEKVPQPKRKQILQGVSNKTL